MKLVITTGYEDIYKSGFLDYALSSCCTQQSFKAYAEYLKTQPVMSFTDEENWSLHNGTIMYSDSGQDEYYNITAEFTHPHSKERILHSVEAGSSWFFLVGEDSELTALYVD